MTKEDIINELNTILSPFNGKGKRILSEDHLKNNLGIDSIDIVDIVVAIEDSFCIKIEDTKVYSMMTVNDIVNLIYEKINEDK